MSRTLWNMQRRCPTSYTRENNLYTCSNDAQDRIKEKIAEHNLNRVVVASCTPRTHEPLFRNTHGRGRAQSLSL